ncbi:MAG: N-formylglutamate amidohydrolase [Planctomycetes bacterium]|nr:N-formylglutamate amidohydrolase [Planctomycetota bacterium]MCB9885438.1 N-formylglutamate amidohydrolase [Planctomycetota bacterium]
MRKQSSRPVVVVSCEHASPRVPAPLRGLGLPADVLRSHRAFDVGALPVARRLAAACGVGLVAGTWSRLVADLNRSAHHPAVIARRVDGRAVPGNRLSAAERSARLSQYWQPYRDEVERRVARASRDGFCVHFSVHSFVERLGGVERRNDIGLLFDPHRPRERAVATLLRERLVQAGWSVRFNFPYFGNTDGLTSFLRARHRAADYLGFEVELNQRVARTADGQRRLARDLVAAVRAYLSGCMRTTAST